MAEAIGGTLLEQGETRGFERGVAQGIERGVAQGIERGIEQGETRAKLNAVLKLLQRKFRNIPETLTAKLNAIESHAALDDLFEQALDAETLDEIHL